LDGWLRWEAEGGRARGGERAGAREGKGKRGLRTVYIASQSDAIPPWMMLLGFGGISAVLAPEAWEMRREEYAKVV
jgi:hypothetical protein